MSNEWKIMYSSLGGVYMVYNGVYTFSTPLKVHAEWLRSFLAEK